MYTGHQVTRRHVCKCQVPTAHTTNYMHSCTFGSLLVMRPRPFAADHLTTVSLSCSPTSNTCITCACICVSVSLSLTILCAIPEYKARFWMPMHAQQVLSIPHVSHACGNAETCVRTAFCMPFVCYITETIAMCCCNRLHTQQLRNLPIYRQAYALN